MSLYLEPKHSACIEYENHQEVCEGILVSRAEHHPNLFDIRYHWKIKSLQGKLKIMELDELESLY